MTCPLPSCWKSAWPNHALVAEVALWQGWLDNVETLFPSWQDHTLRASWKTQLRAAARHLHGCGVQAHPGRGRGHPQARAQGPRVGGAAHARGRRQCTPTFPSTATTYEMLQTAHEAVARIMVLARSLDGVISASTASASPSWSFDRRRVAAFADYKRKGGPGRPLQQRASCYEIRSCPRLLDKRQRPKTLQTLR